MSVRTSALALGAFAVGTSGYIVAGVLPALSSELSVSVSTAGLLTTSFALAYAVGSPLLAALTGRWERRQLLVAALLLAALGNAFAAVAPDFTLLMIARIVTALGAAVFTPAATAVAADLSEPHHRARAVALVFGGLTIATIVGVPAGSLLAGPIGYRGVFWLVAAFCLLASIAVLVAVPKVAAPPKVTLRQRFAAAADRRVLAVLSMTLLACLGVFTVYTYVGPLLALTAGVHGGTLSLLLCGYGVGGAIGNALGGVVADRFGFRLPLIVSISGSVLALALLPVAGNVPLVAVLLFVWGLATWAFNPPVQQRLIELSPGASGLLLALNASAIYLGVGLSGVVGAVVIDTSGLTALPVVAAVLTAVVLAIHLVASRDRGRGRQVVQREQVEGHPRSKAGALQ
ncbi:MFS transporter [Kutzneria albida]|uniref:Major facilitator superfamily (MFS) profile domain-containing protein n=1 Tax=Kutzneria albida DSM 43870 TaxID=1449976 RepID=W5WLH0_9PSEU|nr:MFS transporter [Kutzneria albida]AHI01412.1 hypothetical protein KALB_8054 [Kutzneria albida DSM 43870]